MNRLHFSRFVGSVESGCGLGLVIHASLRRLVISLGRNLVGPSLTSLRASRLAYIRELRRDHRLMHCGVQHPHACRIIAYQTPGIHDRTLTTTYEATAEHERRIWRALKVLLGE
jgi:hypothetical protein